MSSLESLKDVKVLNKFILFQFEELRDKNNKNSFHETRESGIILKSNFDASTKKPRWVRVIAVGDEVTSDIKVGSRILVQALKWTQESKYKDVAFARTEETYVLAIDDSVVPEE